MSAPREVLTALGREWRERAAGLEAAGYASRGLDVSECADELEAALATPPAVGEVTPFRDALRRYRQAWRALEARASAGLERDSGQLDDLHQASRALVNAHESEVAAAKSTPPAAPTEATVWVDGETRSLLVKFRVETMGDDYSVREAGLLAALIDRCRVAPEVG